MVPRANSATSLVMALVCASFTPTSVLQAHSVRNVVAAMLQTAGNLILGDRNAEPLPAPVALEEKEKRWG